MLVGRRLGFAATLASALWSVTAFSSTSTAPSLVSVLQAAYGQYPERPMAQAIRNEGHAIAQQAAGWLAADPALLLRHEQDTDNRGYRSWEGAVELPLWLPGQRSDRAQVAAATIREGDITATYQQWRIAGEVRELLWSLRIAETEVDWAQRALQGAKALEADVRKRVAAGELAPADLLLVQTETLARKADVVSAESRRDGLLATYHTMTGLKTLPDSITEPATSRTAVADDHPALQLALAVAQRAMAQQAQVRGEQRANPVLSLGSLQERPESGLSYDSAVMMQIQVTLGTARHAAPRKAEAERRLTEAQTALAKVKRELEQALIRARQETEQAARASVLSKQQQDLTAEGLRLSMRAFALGESDLYTLLQARTRALSSERDYLLRLHEQDRATARYHQALGVIPQ